MRLPEVTPDLAGVAWVHGAEGEPVLQAARWEADSVVLRVSKRFSFEANFLYLLMGEERALLLDSGPAADPESEVRELPLRAAVDALIAARAAEAGRREPELVVAHTHGHGDHVQGDGQFRGRPRTRVVGLSPGEVRAFWGLGGWPEGEGGLDLGGRRLVAFPIPGHEATHVAVWDERTRALIVGDTLYPGLLTVRDWGAFRASARRMTEFARRHPVGMVLGHHIEMSRRPGVLYPMGTRFQPEEHPLPLGVGDIEALHRLCEAMGEAPRDAVTDRFAIELRPGAV